MTTATATAATSSSTASVILASDFSDRTTDVNRNVWTPDKLETLAEVLDGAPVLAITLDSGTGFTMTNVTLYKRCGYGSSHSRTIGVTSTFESGETQTTLYLTFKIGPAIVLAGNEKWEAIRLYRERKTQALLQGREMLKDIVGEDYVLGSTEVNMIGAHEASVSWRGDKGGFHYVRVAV